MTQILSNVFKDDNYLWIPNDMEFNISKCKAHRNFVIALLEAEKFLTYSEVKRGFGFGRNNKNDMQFYMEWNDDFKYCPELLIDFEVFKDCIVINFNCIRIET